MKRTFLTLIMMVILGGKSLLSAQITDSLISIKGYYVTTYVKNEVAFSYEQQVKKERKQSYSIPIDYRQTSFFIPTQIGSRIVHEKEIITENFLTTLQDDSIYVVPRANNIDLLKTIGIITSDISKEICILYNGLKLSPYYEANNNDSLLFHCIYIEGNAKYKHIQEIEKKWRNYLLNICFVDKMNEKAEFFFIVQINSYTPYIEFPKLKKWIPYNYLKNDLQSEGLFFRDTRICNP